MLWSLPGAGRSIRLDPGPAGFLLCHFAMWFHHSVESLIPPPFDDWGYARRLIRGSETTWSNHASGTAVDLNASAHPLGVRNTFSDAQMSRIRARLRGRYVGTIAWGADWRVRADEMHYEVVCPSTRATQVADSLRATARGRRLADANRKEPA